MRRFIFKDTTSATFALLAAGLLVSLLIAPAQADVYTWGLGETGGEWTAPANWNPNTDYPRTALDTAIFDTTVTAVGHQTITQASDIILEKLEFTAVDSSRQLRIGDSAHTITFAGADPTLQSNAYYGGWAALNINSKVDVGTGGLTVTSTGPANRGTRLSGGILGSGDVTLNYGGLELNAASGSFTGEFIINSNGQVQVLGNSNAKLGDTANGTVINSTGILRFRGASGTTSEPFEVNGINTIGSISNFVSSVTINGPVTLNHDASFSIYDWASGGTAGTKRDFFINSVIADGSGGPHNVYFLGNLSGSSAQGTESRKGEMVLGAQSTYGSNTYVTTNKANVGSDKFSGNLRLAIDDALPTGTTLTLGGSHVVASGTLGTGAGNAKFALGGHDQELAGLLTSGTGEENRVVGNSTTLSTLTLNIASGTNTYGGYLGWTDTDDNNLALVKKGDGTLELSGANSYTGPTDVDAGTLLVDGTHTGGGLYTVDGGATLGGTGALDAAVDVASGGHVAPGASTESLEIGALSMTAGSLFDVEIGGPNAGAAVDGYDQLDVSGTVELDGATLNLSLLNGYLPGVGNAFYLLVNDGSDAITGTFTFEGDSLDEGEQVLLGSTTFLATYQADWLSGSLGGGNDFALTSVPEPSTIILAVLGLLGLVSFGWRRRGR